MKIWEFFNIYLFIFMLYYLINSVIRIFNYFLCMNIVIWIWYEFKFVLISIINGLRFGIGCVFKIENWYICYIFNNVIKVILL